MAHFCCIRNVYSHTIFFNKVLKISILKNYQNLFYRNGNSHVISGEACSYLSPCTISQHIGILPSCHSSNSIAKDVPLFHKTQYMTTYWRDGLKLHHLLSSIYATLDHGSRMKYWEGKKNNFEIKAVSIPVQAINWVSILCFSWRCLDGSEESLPHIGSNPSL